MLQLLNLVSPVVSCLLREFPRHQIHFLLEILLVHTRLHHSLNRLYGRNRFYRRNRLYRHNRLYRRNRRYGRYRRFSQTGFRPSGAGSFLPPTSSPASLAVSGDPELQATRCSLSALDFVSTYARGSSTRTRDDSNSSNTATRSPAFNSCWNRARSP